VVTVTSSNYADPIYSKTLVYHPDFYLIALLDPINGHTNAEVQAQSLDAKERSIVLRDPDAVIALKEGSGLRFNWKFEFEGGLYTWTRENLLSRNLRCSYTPLRKCDDHPISVALFESHMLLSKASKFTMLDYNVLRLGIQDLKGLEICLLMSVLSFLDAWSDRDTGDVTKETIRLREEEARLAKLRKEERRQQLLQQQQQANGNGSPKTRQNWPWGVPS